MKAESLDLNEDDRWDNHAEFLEDMAYYISNVCLASRRSRGAALSIYTKWVTEQAFRHTEKHLQDDISSRAREKEAFKAGKRAGERERESRHEDKHRSESVKTQSDSQDGAKVAKEGVKVHGSMGEKWDDAKRADWREDGEDNWRDDDGK